MTTIKRIIVSLKTIRPHIDDYWFAIPSMVNTIGDLKIVLTEEENVLNAEEVDLFMDNVLLRDNSMIDMIADKDRIEIKAKSSANITTDVKKSAKKKKKKHFDCQPMAKDITVTDNSCVKKVDKKHVKQNPIINTVVNSLDISSMNNGIKQEPIGEEMIESDNILIHNSINKMVNNLRTKSVKREPISDEEEEEEERIKMETEVMAMVNIKVEKQSFEDNNDKDVIDISDESSSEDSSDDESTDRSLKICFNNRTINDKNVSKHELQIKSMVQIQDNNSNTVIGNTSSKHNASISATHDNQLLSTSSDNNNYNKQQTRKPIHKCDICDNIFENEWSFVLHMRYKHKIDLRPFKCTLEGCRAVFKLSEQLEIHKQRKHLPTGAFIDTIGKDSSTTSEYNINDTTDGSLVLTKNRFICDYNGCNKSFLKEPKFIRHKQFTHFICCQDYCRQTGRSVYDLVVHMRNDHNIDWFPYKCSRRYCGQEFKSLKQLKEHKFLGHSRGIQLTGPFS
ncbi:zinc finger and BTB domain-containing protein 11-like isoform X2 [Oppia nitens]|uniref:zinc finger and BTB domain-containing protein 11-like isoform X2 n=1 Tax=Oppia nitens TaxID=1686743 RepID=UPI0023DB4F4E|nr:zinc finger and BTB domain-containing protein 11-like isoform X2 [Oppia nitens]